MKLCGETERGSEGEIARKREREREREKARERERRTRIWTVVR